MKFDLVIFIYVFWDPQSPTDWGIIDSFIFNLELYLYKVTADEWVMFVVDWNSREIITPDGEHFFEEVIMSSAHMLGCIHCSGGNGRTSRIVLNFSICY